MHASVTDIPAQHLVTVGKGAQGNSMRTLYAMVEKRRMSDPSPTAPITSFAPPAFYDFGVQGELGWSHAFLLKVSAVSRLQNEGPFC